MAADLVVNVMFVCSCAFTQMLPHEQEVIDDAALFDDVIEAIAGEPAKKRRKRKKQKKVRCLAMPDYIKNNDEMKKYWHQRYRIFSKFDCGVMLDQGITQRMSDNELLALVWYMQR